MAGASGERAAGHAREGEAESPYAGRFAEAVRGRGINRLSFGDLGRGEGTEERSEITAGERLEEMLMMGLRLNETVPRARFRRECGVSVRNADRALQIG